MKEDQGQKPPRSRLLGMSVLAACVVAAIGMASVYLQKISLAAAALRPEQVNSETLRALVWWAVGSASAFAMVLFAGEVLQLRVRVGSTLRGLLDVAALALIALLGPAAVGIAIEASKSGETFECIIPGRLPVWSPSAVALIAVALVILRGNGSKRAA